MSHQSNSKSPNSAGRRPVMHHASISNIPEIDDIKGKNQLILGKERIDKIKYSLDI